MNNPILTILVPTYNRANYLSSLLKTLVLELHGLETRVRVIVADNASNDQTAKVIDAFINEYPNTLILRHTENIGPDENFCRCIENVQSKYFWLIGDDDLPKANLIRRIVNLLEQGDYDIIYMNSEWLSDIASARDDKADLSITVKMLSRENFARKVNVWATFISCMVINLERLHVTNPDINIRRFSGTQLVQLGWVLPLLMHGMRFCYIKQKCILATLNNTYNYDVVTVFGKNFIEIVQNICGKNSTIYNSIIKILIWCLLPNLIWKSRFEMKGNFFDENQIKILKKYKSKLVYWILFLPIQKFPKPIAFIFYLFSKILWKTNKLINN